MNLDRNRDLPLLSEGEGIVWMLVALRLDSQKSKRISHTTAVASL